MVGRLIRDTIVARQGGRGGGLGYLMRSILPWGVLSWGYEEQGGEEILSCVLGSGQNGRLIGVGFNVSRQVVFGREGRMKNKGDKKNLTW